jgi:hypothetical protein
MFLFFYTASIISVENQAYSYRKDRLWGKFGRGGSEKGGRRKEKYFFVDLLSWIGVGDFLDELCMRLPIGFCGRIDGAVWQSGQVFTHYKRRVFFLPFIFEGKAVFVFITLLSVFSKTGTAAFSGWICFLFSGKFFIGRGLFPRDKRNPDRSLFFLSSFFLLWYDLFSGSLLSGFYSEETIQSREKKFGACHFIFLCRMCTGELCKPIFDDGTLWKKLG